jgi:hypothetical protein
MNCRLGSQYVPEFMKPSGYLSCSQNLPLGYLLNQFKSHLVTPTFIRLISILSGCSCISHTVLPLGFVPKTIYIYIYIYICNIYICNIYIYIYALLFAYFQALVLWEGIEECMLF